MCNLMSGQLPIIQEFPELAVTGDIRTLFNIWQLDELQTIRNTSPGPQGSC